MLPSRTRQRPRPNHCRVFVAILALVGLVQQTLEAKLYTVSPGTGTPIISNGVITGIAVLHPGSGFYRAPTVTIIDSGGGTGATAIATLSGCEVGSVTVTNGGSGYSIQTKVLLLPIHGDPQHWDPCTGQDPLPPADPTLGQGFLRSTSQELHNNWRQVPWFGVFYVKPATNWIFHNGIGWVYIPPCPSSDSIWLWHPGQGWIWTREGLYPEFHSQRYQGRVRHVLSTGIFQGLP